MRRGIPGFGSDRFRNAVIVVGILFAGALLIGGIGRLGGGGAGPENYDEYVNEFLGDFQPEVTATRLVDPWIPPAGATPAARRFVALEVTIEYPEDRQEAHYVSSSYFKLVDTEDFAHGALLEEIDSPLREGLQLDPGQKTKGWVLFEIDRDTEIKSVVYGLREISLPQAEDGTIAEAGDAPPEP